MEIKAEFLRIMAEQTEIALATSVNNVPNVRIVGDRTGGGAGLPFSAELPNGWLIRFSACPMYDKNKQMTEFGIDPDYKVNLTSEDFHRGKDTIIEFARHLVY